MTDKERLEKWIIKEYTGGKTLRQLCKELSCSMMPIRRILKDNNIVEARQAVPIWKRKTTMKAVDKNGNI